MSDTIRPRVIRPTSRVSFHALRVQRTGWGRLRARHGLSLRDLEQLTGINRGTLSQVEAALRPSPDQARTLLALYDSLDEDRLEVGGGG